MNVFCIQRAEPLFLFRAGRTRESARGFDLLDLVLRNTSALLMELFFERVAREIRPRLGSYVLQLLLRKIRIKAPAAQVELEQHESCAESGPHPEWDAREPLKETQSRVPDSRAPGSLHGDLGRLNFDGIGRCAAVGFGRFLEDAGACGAGL